MSDTARWVGLLLAVAMALFSAVIFLKTGDWVAAVFLLGALGYSVFFFSARMWRSSDER